MADLSYGLDRGVTLPVEGTASGGFDVEVLLDNAVNLTRKEAILALQYIIKVIQEDDRFAEI